MLIKLTTIGEIRLRPVYCVTITSVKVLQPTSCGYSWKQRQPCSISHFHACTRRHYPVVVGVDVGHRPIQWARGLEAVVSVNTL